MLDDGEKLVPGFRQARALRMWTGVRPLFEDAKAARYRHSRRHAAPTRCSTTRERDGSARFFTITGGKLTTFRLMAAETMDAASSSSARPAGHDLHRAATRL